VIQGQGVGHYLLAGLDTGLDVQHVVWQEVAAHHFQSPELLLAGGTNTKSRSCMRIIAAAGTIVCISLFWPRKVALTNMRHA